MCGYDSWKTRSDLDDWAAQNHEPPEERPTFTESEVAAAVEAERAACEKIARKHYADGYVQAEAVYKAIAARKEKT